MDTDLKKIYCPQEDCPDNIAYTCGLGGKMPEGLMFAAGLGNSQLGIAPIAGIMATMNGLPDDMAEESPYFSNWHECPRTKDKKK